MNGMIQIRLERSRNPFLQVKESNTSTPIRCLGRPPSGRNPFLQVKESNVRENGKKGGRPAERRNPFLQVKESNLARRFFFLDFVAQVVIPFFRSRSPTIKLGGPSTHEEGRNPFLQVKESNDISDKKAYQLALISRNPFLQVKESNIADDLIIVRG